MVDLSMMQNTQSDDTGDPMKQRNEQRREDRIRRENLMRTHSARRDNIADELKQGEQELKELRNKVRFEKGSIDDQEQKIADLEAQLKRVRRNHKRDSFEFQQNKARMLEITRDVQFKRTELARIEKRLKKIEIEGK